MTSFFVKSKAALHNLKTLAYTVLTLVVAAPVVLAIMWLTPVFIVILIGVVIFCVIKVLTAEADNTSEDS